MNFENYTNNFEFPAIPFLMSLPIIGQNRESLILSNEKYCYTLPSTNPYLAVSHMTQKRLSSLTNQF